jgi:hypothetical protein
MALVTKYPPILSTIILGKSLVRSTRLILTNKPESLKKGGDIMKLFLAHMQPYIPWLKFAFLLAVIIVALIVYVAPASASPDVTGI